MKYKNKQIAQLKQFEKIITIEDHLIDCGFGSWIRESMNNHDLKTKIINI